MAAYRAEETRRPLDPEVKRSLGIALLRSGDAHAAERTLVQARELAPGNPQVHFFLARARENLAEPDSALHSYLDYLSSGGKNTGPVRARIRELSSEISSRDVRLALAREDSLRTVPPPANTLAVPDFVNVTESEPLAPLSKGLAAVLITDLRKVKGFRLVERERLHVLLQELAMASSGWDPIGTVRGLKQRLHAIPRPGTDTPYYEGTIDGIAGPDLEAAIRSFQRDRNLLPNGQTGPETTAELERAVQEAEGPGGAAGIENKPVVAASTAPRMGHLLGASKFVQGFFTPLNDSRIQLNADLVEATGGGTLPGTEPVEGALPDVLRLMKPLVYQTLTRLGVEPTAAERQSIDVLATDSFQAFLSYSRGLTFEDEGRLDEAAAAYEQAVQEDPSFAAAEESEQSLTETSDVEGIEDDEQAAAAPAPPESPGTLVTDIAVQVGSGPSPDTGGMEGDTGYGGTDAEDPGSDSPTDTERVPPPRIPDFPPPPGVRP